MRATIGISTAAVKGSRGFLTVRPASHAPSFCRPMLEDVIKRVERRLKAVGLSASAASSQAGLSKDAIRNMQRALKEDGREGVSTRTISALAPVLRTSVAYLLEGEGPEEAGGIAGLCEVVGRVGADPEGRILYATGDRPLAWAPPPPGGSPAMPVLLVVGDSMPGFAPNGSLIYLEEQRNPPAPDMLGDVVAVELESGEVLLKRLLRGSEPGLWDLESIAGPTRRDERVVWAAFVYCVVPPRAARRILVDLVEAA
jgi:hypothetical protein